MSVIATHTKVPTSSISEKACVLCSKFKKKKKTVTAKLNFWPECGIAGIPLPPLQQVLFLFFSFLFVLFFVSKGEFGHNYGFVLSGVGREEVCG